MQPSVETATGGPSGGELAAAEEAMEALRMPLLLSSQEGSQEQTQAAMVDEDSRWVVGDKEEDDDIAEPMHCAHKADQLVTVTLSLC